MVTKKQIAEARKELARMGGLALAKKRTKEQRSDAARKAVRARWDKAKASET
jgi:hypothetical protein